MFDTTTKSSGIATDTPARQYPVAAPSRPRAAVVRDRGCVMVDGASVVEHFLELARGTGGSLIDFLPAFEEAVTVPGRSNSGGSGGV